MTTKYDSFTSPCPGKTYADSVILQARRFRSRDKRLAAAEETFNQKFRSLSTSIRSTVFNALDSLYAEYILYLRGNTGDPINIVTERMIFERHRLGEVFQYALTDIFLTQSIRVALTSVYHVMYASMTTCLAVVKASDPRVVMQR